MQCSYSSYYNCFILMLLKYYFFYKYMTYIFIIFVYSNNKKKKTIRKYLNIFLSLIKQIYLKCIIHHTNKI